jgi:hypothetical protein
LFSGIVVKAEACGSPKIKRQVSRRQGAFAVKTVRSPSGSMPGTFSSDDMVFSISDTDFAICRLSAF